MINLFTDKDKHFSSYNWSQNQNKIILVKITSSKKKDKYSAIELTVIISISSTK